MTTVAIIGTAGRGEDKRRLTHGHYTRMFVGVTTVIGHLGLDVGTLKLVSGGAAWADHLAVRFKILAGIDSKNLTLYLPTELGDQGYYGDNERSQKTADTANYYHREFSKTIGRDSIQELITERSRGCNFIPGNGNFHARNASVAKAVTPDGILLAFTFGAETSDQPPWTARDFTASATAEQAGLKDGGTAHTFGLAKCLKWHLRLGDLTDADTDYL